LFFNNTRGDPKFFVLVNQITKVNTLLLSFTPDDKQMPISSFLMRRIGFPPDYLY